MNDFEKLGKNIGESVYLEPSGEISVTYGNDQIARLRNQYEYLMKQEQWLVELMCGKIEEEKQEEKQ